MGSEADETGTRYRHNLSKLSTSFHSIGAALKMSVSFHFWQCSSFKSYMHSSSFSSTVVM